MFGHFVVSTSWQIDLGSFHLTIVMGNGETKMETETSMETAIIWSFGEFPATIGDRETETKMETRRETKTGKRQKSEVSGSFPQLCLQHLLRDSLHYMRFADQRLWFLG